MSEVLDLQKLSNKSNLKWCGEDQNQETVSEDSDSKKISETNSSFHVK